MVRNDGILSPYRPLEGYRHFAPNPLCTKGLRHESVVSLARLVAAHGRFPSSYHPLVGYNAIALLPLEGVG
jgi:hypothetical protein